jgi:hypothetical protein
VGDHVGEGGYIQGSVCRTGRYAMALLPAPLLAGTSTMQLSGWQVPWMGNATGSSRACACPVLFAVHAQLGCVLSLALVAWLKKGCIALSAGASRLGPWQEGRGRAQYCASSSCV